MQINNPMFPHSLLVNMFSFDSFAHSVVLLSLFLEFSDTHTPVWIISRICMLKIGFHSHVWYLIERGDFKRERVRDNPLTFRPCIKFWPPSFNPFPFPHPSAVLWTSRAEEGYLEMYSMTEGRENWWRQHTKTCSTHTHTTMIHVFYSDIYKKIWRCVTWILINFPDKNLIKNLIQHKLILW